ncbi:calcium-translocating P-type ATPase, PMCA-type [Segatella albensis]|uniref:calcium-translocating P-type ATPase, PMCA-type n=1 Tax=Segatella albensis TaxID=77768 RepID=UPI0004270458|nr:calcium-translocating P-type ATPase, PMCA-type [Segatella albensis]
MDLKNTSENFYIQGLNDAQVAESRKAHGQNVLTPPKRTSLWMLYLEKYRDPIIQILLVAAAISLVLAFLNKDFVETIGIFAAIILATTVGFYFERDAAKKFGVLTALGEEQPVKVRRNGRVMEIPRRDVVVGDIILVEVGDEIPADGKLFFATDLQVNESQLTGEPICTKSLDAKGENTYPDDVVLRSTMVMNGRGEAVVTAVGDDTEIGKVARQATEKTDSKTPLNLQLDRLAHVISKVGTGIAVAAFVTFLVHDIVTNPEWGGHNYLRMTQIVLDYFMMSVTLIVMAVPEGLPMAVTLSLALNMRRMLKSNNLVRKLHACETMGAVTVICTDKTGTLTQNKMQVGEVFMVDGADKELLAQGIAVNSTAELDGDMGIGNPTEVALLLWMKRNDMDYRSMRSDAEIIAQVPFSTEKKYMETTVRVGENRMRFIKGAPEVVMAKCKIEEEEYACVAQQLTSAQNRAMRTLAFAVARDDEPMHLQAVVAIADPIREDVPEAVMECRRAGVQVKVVTGDTVATALEISRQIHLFDDVEYDHSRPLLEQLDKEWYITGPEWATLSDDEAYQRAAKIRVMSRARPTDKQRLVALLQKRGEVVAVTGDGTNDAPALNYAHVGLSLGSGTSVAKEASDMTLLDDSFGSIVNAIMWGRSLYRNIQRFLFFQLVVNVAALLLVLGGAVLGTELPLTVTQILWVNLIMDTFAAMALASLPPSKEVMAEKPRRRNEFIITKQLTRGILLCGTAFFAVMFVFLWWCERRGQGGVDVRELTWFFTSFVMMQMWNLFNAKCLGTNHSAFRKLWADRGLMLVVVIILVGQWIIVTLGGDMMRTVPLSLKEWGVIIAATSMVLWIGELWRGVKRLIKK